MQYYNIGSYYACQVSQSGTADPSENVLGNHSFTDFLTWERMDVGIYRATLAGAFPANRTQFIYTSIIVKTSIDSSPPTSPIEDIGYANIFVSRVDDDTILLKQFDSVSLDPVDGLLSVNLEIRVYGTNALRG